MSLYLCRIKRVGRSFQQISDSKCKKLHIRGSVARGVHLTRLWSGTCHRGFKNIPVPYTTFLKSIPDLLPIFRKRISELIFHTKILKIGTFSLFQIVKIDVVLYINVWKICKIDTLPDGTSRTRNICSALPESVASVQTLH